MSIRETLDQMMSRMLWVTPLPEQEEDLISSTPAVRAFGFSLLISGFRCILQYIVLPVVLPLIGLVGNFSLTIVIVLDVVAMGLLISSLRYFWRVQHPRRWDMLPLSTVILLIIVGSLSYDLWKLFT